MKNELGTIKEIVREVMQTDNKTRNSDKWLILQVLRKMGFKIYVNYEDLREMPSFESITRARRYIQNTEGKLVPTPQVDKLRQSNQEDYIREFSR